MSLRHIDRLAAWVLLVLGTLVLLGRSERVVNGVRDHDLDAPFPRLLVILLVVVAIRTAAPRARRVNIE